MRCFGLQASQEGDTAGAEEHHSVSLDVVLDRTIKTVSTPTVIEQANASLVVHVLDHPRKQGVPPVERRASVGRTR
jgi:hypothetical protein